MAWSTDSAPSFSSYFCIFIYTLTVLLSLDIGLCAENRWSLVSCTVANTREISCRRADSQSRSSLSARWPARGCPWILSESTADGACHSRQAIAWLGQNQWAWFSGRCQARCTGLQQYCPTWGHCKWIQVCAAFPEFGSAKCLLDKRSSGWKRHYCLPCIRWESYPISAWQ